ncbi:MAG: hypothetical protein EYC62_01850 [Alphaproteobacteria bacterium]|nr:MAG: hypothetical protein EYC62_01850 [Alphaproteobacteria bacterium]
MNKIWLGGSNIIFLAAIIARLFISASIEEQTDIAQAIEFYGFWGMGILPFNIILSAALIAFYRSIIKKPIMNKDYIFTVWNFTGLIGWFAIFAIIPLMKISTIG